MLSAKLTNETRMSIYRRDGYRCALCDFTMGLQIHHVVPRSKGGTNSPHNLICLCADCHALAHGTMLKDWNVTQEDIVHACVEYLADYYAGEGYLWSPWAADPEDPALNLLDHRNHPMYRNHPCETCALMDSTRGSCIWNRYTGEDCPHDIRGD